ncbi:MAG: prevent-host-death family protein [Planktothrix sp. GU0601_MAG3]|nr:MAG: prevent-host-death family protein [Planktothrix sp. GU0601_MAG3]
MNSFKQLPLSELRASLPKFKRQVQLGMKRIAATYYGEVVGFLVPLKDIAGLEEDGWITKTEEMSLTDFRAGMTECWERLQLEVDCIYLTFHTRRAAAFVSPRLMPHLPIPISDVAYKLLDVDSEIVEHKNSSI